MSNVVVLQNYQLTKEPGLHYRIVCMTGDKRGEVYYIKGKRILLGRSKESDIVIYDSQSSREHAELSKFGSSYVITDLKSNNGIAVNGKKIKQILLKTKDRIVIGKTVYKFEILKINENNLGGHLALKRKEIEEKRVEVGSAQKKRKALILLVFVLGISFLISEDEEPEKKQAIVQREGRNNNFFRRVQRKKQEKKSDELQKRIDTIMQRGTRELREGNYDRAINEFNLALIVDSQNARALAYKRKSKELQDVEIQSYFDQASRDFESYNISSVVKNYCQIIKILENSPEDERRKSADENLLHLVNEYGVDKDAASCN